MLWRPATSGEATFLYIYENVGRHITVQHPVFSDMDFLVNAQSFNEFARLHATIEVFVRCLRAAVFLQDQIGHLSATQFGRQLAKRDYLSSNLSGDRKFCEMIKLTSSISFRHQKASDPLGREIREATRRCYLCGIKLTKSSPEHSVSTVEHLWPLSLGGESIPENLIAACADCNEKRGNSITWAWGPVQSTDYSKQPDTNADSQLRISLALAKLMFVASGKGTGTRLTLKEAALRNLPLLPNLDIKDGRHRVYFELLDEVRKAG
jgi:5-methylcytosine-specific restriction endonuclease McrA